MKIVTLNIWAGSVGKKLIDFFKENKDIDVFCLQEVMHEATSWTKWGGQGNHNGNVLQEIRDALPNHVDYFRPAENKGEWGLAILIKKTIPVDEEGETFIHLHRDSMVVGDGTTIGKNLQWIVLKKHNLTIFNVHGLWNGKGKTDTEDRINQSQKIINTIKRFNNNVLLCGDFNLLPDTKSLQMIEDELGLKNLIKEFNVGSTRTSYYTKEPKFADYILVSPDIYVSDFKVLPDEVSDHSPLYLEIE